MLPLAAFDNLHQVLRNLYQDMMPLCSDMVGVAKGVAGMGALFYVAHRVWKSLSNAEPIDVYPLLRPFAIGLCIMFFPVFVLGTINSVMSPVVQGANGIFEKQKTSVADLQKQKDALEYDARAREGKAWLVDDDEYDKKMSELGIRQIKQIVCMWGERTMYDMKMWFREFWRSTFELFYHAAALLIDTLRTFGLIVLAILGPLSFALSVYDGFQSSLTNWIAKYIAVYLWLPVSDIFSAVMSRIQALMLQMDIDKLHDPSFIPDGSNGMYIVFLLIGICGYLTVPTVSEWIIQAGGMGSANSGIGKVGSFGAGLAGGMAGNAIGRLIPRGGGSKGSGGGSPSGQNMATSGGSSSGGTSGQNQASKGNGYGNK